MMKWIFIFLLLVNTLYFGWELDRQTRMDVTGTASLPAIPGQAKHLRFLSELDALPPLREVSAEYRVKKAPDPEVSMASIAVDPGESSAPSEENVAAGADDQAADISASKQQNGPGSCFSFGPIAEEVQASGLHHWFVSNGGQAQMRHKDEQGRQLFWVYLAPQESRQEAMKTIRGFQNKGIQDFRLIVKGNLQNAISMGLFSSQASVNKRLRELEKKGYNPVVVPYSDGKRAYWVDARLPEDEAVLGKVFKGYPAKFNSVPVRCMEIAIGSDYS